MSKFASDYTRGRAVCAVDFRHIKYGRPAITNPAAIYVEGYPDWADNDEFDYEEWERSHTSFWAMDRQAIYTAYRILRAFRKHDTVAIDGWPEGLAIGQIGTGKHLVINGPAKA